MVKNIIEQYTFENFIVSDSNKFAHAAAKGVAEGCNNYNPLYIYSGSGLGKTHLLYAIRHAVERDFPHRKVIYTTGDDYLNELIIAIKNGKSVEFRDKFREADIILMDDIHFIAGKERTQDELLNTFNALYELGKQVVFTSNRPPGEIRYLEENIKERFESGLIVDIQAPDKDLRVAIIKKTAKQLGVLLPDDVIGYIADNIVANIFQLKGAVNLIVEYHDCMGFDITVASVNEHLMNVLTDS